MLAVQKFLRDARFATVEEAFAALTAELGVKVRDYPERGVALLDYDQIESPKSHPIVIECRSLIVDRITLNVVSRKFDRFFNLGECPDFYIEFDFANSFVMEKADGSLIGVWYDQKADRWEVSTRGMAFAEGEHMMGGTFRDRVIAAFGFETEDQFQDTFDKLCLKGATYIFEYTSPENRIVTKYAKSEMVLLGVRFIAECGAQMPIGMMSDLVSEFQLQGLSVRLPKMYDAVTDSSALVELADALPDLQEGFVVWDPVCGKRVKIKAKTYLIAHKLRGNDTVPTRKNLMILVLEGEVDEFLAYFPEWTESIRECQTEVAELERGLLTVWDASKDIESQKEFALQVKDVRGSGVLFEARKKTQEPVHVFHGMELTKKLRLFGL
jgi:hypothetical protein